MLDDLPLAGGETGAKLRCQHAVRRPVTEEVALGQELDAERPEPLAMNCWLSSRPQRGRARRSQQPLFGLYDAADHGVDEPMAGVQVEEAPDNVELDRADLAESEAALGRRRLEELRHESGLDGREVQGPVSILGGDRGQLRDDEDGSTPSATLATSTGGAGSGLCGGGKSQDERREGQRQRGHASATSTAAVAAGPVRVTGIAGSIDR